MSFNNFKQGDRRRGKLFFIPFGIAALALLLGGIVMWLWNAILPDLLHVSRINFWQSVGLLALCRILFGNFGKGGPKHHMRGMDARREGGRLLRDKWMQMTDEERAKFKDEWRDRCGPRWGRRD